MKITFNQIVHNQRYDILSGSKEMPRFKLEKNGV